MASDPRGSISRRKYIKWGSTFPVENTTTVVLSSPSRRFVDVRLLLTNPNSLDWAFAGTSTSTPLTSASPASDGGSDGTYHAVFHHWVDSRHADAAAVVDEGDMRPGALPGESLEAGTMERVPGSGAVEPYEECWHDAPAGDPTLGDGRGWVLQRGGDEAGVERGVMARVGALVQGVLRTGPGGDDVFVGRWRVEEKKPAGLVGGARDLVESHFYLGDWDALKLGDEIQSGDGGRWVCVESW